MATIKTVYAGTESKWGILERDANNLGEAAFGTANDDTDDAEMIESKIGVVDSGVFRVNTVKGGDGRMRNIANDFVSTKGGLRIISFSDMVVRYKDLGWLLYAVCQNVTEGADPFEKTYTLSTSTTQPDFSANAGFFFTLGIYDTIASYHRKYTSCILKSLTLNFDMAGDGLIRASGEFISGFAESTTANFSGTWAYNTQNYFNFHVTPVIKLGGNDAILYSGSITINNNAVRVGSAGATGNCETYALATGEPGYEVIGNVKVKFDTNMQGLIAADKAGTTQALQIACGSDGVAGNFDLTAANCLFQNVADDYEDVRGRALDVPFIAHSSVAFTVTDGLSRGW